MPASSSLASGLAASFAAACDASGALLAEPYRIAGEPVSLRFATAALRDRLTAAFSHLRADPAGEEPALTINLWDSASTGCAPPPHPAVPEGGAQGALYHFSEPPLRGVYQPGFESLSVLDGEARTAWHWVGSAFELAYWDQACPIRQLLFWWLGSRGLLQVHGASVGTASGGVLVVGKGGSGKSTVALSSLGSGLLYAGDDYVAVGLEPAPRIESLYSSGKLEPDHVQTLLPHLLPLLDNADRLASEKAVLYVQEHFPEQTTAGFPLRAVLVPRVAASRPESRIVEASRAAAFAALAPSTILQLHTADAGAFQTMSRLIERVPCYGLELGSEVGAIPDTIAEFLAGLPPA
ncbi:MAG TPA: hypothetical protein VF002_04860 [Gaiellaceae bacterium]